MIRYKSITHERTEDAPFIGALVCAIGCKYNCEDCFNQHLKDNDIIQDTAKNIILEVMSNPFNKGIILGGLEWTQQPYEMKELVYEALDNNLSVILYTGMEETEFKRVFIDVYNLPICIKFGRYEKELQSDTHYSNGVKLVSTNQYINTLRERLCK